MENEITALQKVGAAVNHNWLVSQAELFFLLDITPGITSLGETIDKLFNVTRDPVVSMLDMNTQLAVIRTAQELIGLLYCDGYISFIPDD